jgi:hypothetical protein
MPKFPDNLSDEQRLASAKGRTDRLVDHVTALFGLHEANALIIYSPMLSSQIPRSYAAHAFNAFQQSMHLYELVRLCAIWDKPGTDRESIPTILALLGRSEIIEKLVQDTYRSYASDAMPHDLRPTDDPDIEAAKAAWWERYRVERAEEQAQKVRDWIATAQEKADAIIASPALKSLRGFRDAYVAHNLTPSETPPNMQDEVRPVRYGDETPILDATVEIVDALHLALNGTSFDWEGARGIAANNARDLWNGCRFEIRNPMRRRSLPE